MESDHYYLGFHHAHFDIFNYLQKSSIIEKTLVQQSTSTSLTLVPLLCDCSFGKPESTWLTAYRPGKYQVACSSVPWHAGDGHRLTWNISTRFATKPWLKTYNPSVAIKNPLASIHRSLLYKLYPSNLWGQAASKCIWLFSGYRSRESLFFFATTDVTVE